MSSLSEICKPSRAGVTAPGAKFKGKKAPSRELPDYVSPEPTTAADRAAWERMSKRMAMFHEHFRSEFQRMYLMAGKVGEVGGVRISELLSVGLAFDQHINGHHSIEEYHIFPILAQRMPAFGDDHLEEHKAMHDGLEKLGAYLRKVQKKPDTFNSEEFRGILASFGPILFYHLDAEVANLKPDILRRYYTLAEVKALPM